MTGRIGKYRIDALIAEGGMACIYRARTEGVGGIDKVVALKCLRESMQEEDSFVEMLLDEARITVRMSHKNICQVYGLEHDDDGTYFLVMEYVDGVDLARLTRWVQANRSGFPIEAAVYVAMEVCAGLSYAHRMADDSGNPLCIVHRDVNPQNICLSREGEVKLIDFGIAKARLASQETQAGTIKGKFNYMSPEQARGDRIDQRADIFALGAVLYEMLSGHMLYPLSLDDAKLKTKARMADFVPIETYVPTIPPVLKQILSKALARDVTQRFATARDFLLALTQFFHSSCKVYDSLNMSMMVSRCLAEEQPAGGFSSGQFSGASKEPLLLDSQDTAVMEASEAQKFVAGTPHFEGAVTSVFDRPDIERLLADRGEKRDVSELNRVVDLSVAPAGTTDTTVMVRIGVEASSSKRVRAQSWLIGRLSYLTDRHLLLMVMALTLVLGVILVFVLTGDGENRSAAEAEAEHVRLDSVPSGARVFVNGVETDLRTPVTLPMGALVMLRHAFYEDRVVDFSAAAEGFMMVEMKPKLGRLNIDSVPSSADVFMDGRALGQTPLTSLVEMVGEHRIEVDLSGYHGERRVVFWKDEEERSIHLNVVLRRVNFGGSDD